MTYVFDAQLDYLDTHWDTMSWQKREQLVLQQLLQTTCFAKKHVPFYHAHYRAFSEQTILALASLEEWACTLPEVTREHISYNPPGIFQPDLPFSDLIAAPCPQKGYFRNYGTGGSTGKPKSIVHSAEDWLALSKILTRSWLFDLGESAFQGLTAYGLYHGDHITNEIYETALNALGVHFVDRVSTKLSPEANYEYIQEVQPHILLGPPETKDTAQSKGITLDSILRLDARNSRARWPLNHRTNMIFVPSGDQATG